MNVELNAELTLASGDRIRWDAASPDAGKRPLAPTFDTETGKGFSNGSVTLQRPTERDYPELRLLNELTLRSATGQIVYQGRAQGIPVGEAFAFDCDGWITHGEQRQITDLLIDREAAAWGDVTNAEKSRLNSSANRGPWGSVSTEGPTVKLELSSVNQTTADGAMALAMYRAPAPISSAKLVLSDSTLSGSTNWAFTASLHNGPTRTTLNGETVINVTQTAPGTQTVTLTATEDLRNITTQIRRTNAFSAEGDFTVSYTPTIYGTAGLTTVTRGDGLDGFYASDAIRYLASRYCPKWSTAGVEETSYPIPHAVWREPTTPIDAIRQLNGYHLWKLGVWENRDLTFAPYDLSVADWQVAAGVDGVRVEYQGDTTENVYNGVAVWFTNVLTGEQERITPEDSEDLRDRSEWISANEWGDEVWLNIDVSWPVAQEDAVEIGRLALANANQARRPSTITVPATIRDIHGSEWPSSYVRSDQTIVVTNQSPAIPRLITRTSWSDHSLSITTDNAVDTFEAFTTRLSGALSASGIL